MRRLFLIPLLFAALTGCGTMTGLPGTGGSSSPGKTFDTAAKLVLDSGSTTFSNTLANASDVNVFDLGPLGPGDHVIISVSAASGSSLDPTIALFDADQNLFTLNDDTNLDANGVLRASTVTIAALEAGRPPTSRSSVRSTGIAVSSTMRASRSAG